MIPVNQISFCNRARLFRKTKNQTRDETFFYIFESFFGNGYRVVARLASEHAKLQKSSILVLRT